MNGTLPSMEQLQARSFPNLHQADLGVLYAKLGRRDDALQEIAPREQRGREGYGVACDEALIYTALGELDRGC